MKRFIRPTLALASLALFSRQAFSLESNAEAQAQAKNAFKTAVNNMPHPDKIEKGGEDAWAESSNFLIVADGVGGWADQGIDPGLFSKQLCFNLK